MEVSKKRLVIISCTSFAIFLFWQQNISKTQQYTHLKTKTILYWTPTFHHKDFYLGLGSVFQNCAYQNCFTTHNRSYLPVEDFDAIIFHAPEYNIKQYGVPEKRKPNQIYIFADMESPVYSGNHYKQFNNFYNWTMTYRMDSDIWRGYGWLEEKVTGYKPPSIEDVKKRPKKAAWFVSRCSSAGKRELIARKLNKTYPVDVYGKCGSLKCPRNTTELCYNLLETDYRYYLSFENSVCREYVTEKLYNVLLKNVVPIVYGGGSYDDAAPPHSVINVKDFSSPEELGLYLKHLDDQPEEYLRYFEWKKNLVVRREISERALCSLCHKLNENIETKVYENIVEWWNRSACSRI